MGTAQRTLRARQRLRLGHIRRAGERRARSHHGNRGCRDLPKSRADKRRSCEATTVQHRRKPSILLPGAKARRTFREASPSRERKDRMEITRTFSLLIAYRDVRNENFTRFGAAGRQNFL